MVKFNLIGKDKILRYCEKFETHSMDDLQTCYDIIFLLEHDKIPTSGCASNWGIDGYEGWCGRSLHCVELSNREKMRQCKECWKEALEMEVKE